VNRGGFFEPTPPPQPDPGRREWAAPAWDRPSEGTVPWLLPVNAIVHQNDDAVVRVESLAVYPNGFVVNVAAHANPHRSQQEIIATIHQAGVRTPRVGIRFSDGRVAGREGELGLPGLGKGQPKDADGFPTEPIVRPTGGGGGGHTWRHGVWVYPLPPEGPLEIYVSLPAAGLEEGMVLVDGAEIRAAAERARVVWE
jgi:hypothetical protein